MVHGQFEENKCLFSIESSSAGVWQTFSMKSLIVTILGFSEQMVSVATLQFCHCGVGTAIDNIQMNECGGVLIKLYLQKGAVG